jgi:phage repressor protein C with HTH and peptisase S24 domain
MIEPITVVPVPTNAPGGVPAASEAASAIDLILARPYQFKMIGDSMRPRYRPGETVYVDPALAPEPDEDHVFFNEQRQAIVGRLIAMSRETWRIAQRAETIRETIIELPVSEWRICHGIIGRRNA